MNVIAVGGNNAKQNGRTLHFAKSIVIELISHSHVVVF